MKIIVVDRDAAIGILYREELEELGHKVIFLNRGAKLLEIMGKEKPEVLILGVRLHDRDYLDLLAMVKSSFPDTKVIFNTSLKGLWPDAQAFGADYYSQKTSDLSDIKNALEAIMAQKSDKPVM